MARVLHLVRSDSHALAQRVIEAMHLAPGLAVSVVLLDGGPAPALPAGVSMRRLAPGDLDYAGLLDLIFEADHVVSW